MLVVGNRQACQWKATKHLNRISRFHDEETENSGSFSSVCVVLMSTWMLQKACERNRSVSTDFICPILRPRPDLLVPGPKESSNPEFLRSNSSMWHLARFSSSCANSLLLTLSVLTQDPPVLHSRHQHSLMPQAVLLVWGALSPLFHWMTSPHLSDGAQLKYHCFKSHQ